MDAIKEPKDIETSTVGSLPNEPNCEGHVVLIPKPSNDPRDPLNWSLRRKYLIAAVLCLSAFAGAVASMSGQLNLTQQEELYNTTKIQESYAFGRMASGPFFFAPISHLLGCSSTIFWCISCTLICQVWTALMTHSDDYVPFITSRAFAGLFGAIPTRGRAFTTLHISFLFGTTSGPTFSGFVSANSFFPVEFWWTVGLLGFNLICCFCLLEETGFDRESPERNSNIPKNLVANRFKTFFFGQSVVLPSTWKETAKVAATPFLIGICPVTILMGIFALISFGYNVSVHALTPVWLQKPVSEGGYGFTLEQNAAFTFCHWVALILVQVHGHFFNDRIPLALARRFNNGIWKTEYRLHVLWLPSMILNPIGLGIFGAALQYHLNYMVLALGVFFVTLGSMASVPVTVNYAVECFLNHPAEAGIVIGSYRIIYGLTISFYVDAWAAAVTMGWVYGLMGFFALVSFFFVMLVMWQGHAIRDIQFASLGLASSEEGEKLLK
ncbi:hypothetical protein N7520_010902 [Penicillium odoratum]|uniref:uncharacterized protein n=1 Tax=Penicillium odoratum TaxID=1167516 RepID=UPI002547E352|nr:uncharacterized protein N7520_010902 [Penicillium odoratum]KAJ5745720.1 hypothetical protein N7520_010902 [Penicillium odoratum]